MATATDLSVFLFVADLLRCCRDGGVSGLMVLPPSQRLRPLAGLLRLVPIAAGDRAFLPGLAAFCWPRTDLAGTGPQPNPQAAPHGLWWRQGSPPAG